MVSVINENFRNIDFRSLSGTNPLHRCDASRVLNLSSPLANKKCNHHYRTSPDQHIHMSSILKYSTCPPIKKSTCFISNSILYSGYRARALCVWAIWAELMRNWAPALCVHIWYKQINTFTVVEVNQFETLFKSPWSFPLSFRFWSRPFKTKIASKFTAQVLLPIQVSKFCGNVRDTDSYSKCAHARAYTKWGVGI